MQADWQDSLYQHFLFQYISQGCDSKALNRGLRSPPFGREWQGRWIHVAITAELKRNVVLAVPWGIGRWPQWHYHCLLQVKREWSLHVFTLCQVVAVQTCAFLVWTVSQRKSTNYLSPGQPSKVQRFGSKWAAVTDSKFIKAVQIFWDCKTGLEQHFSCSFQHFCFPS